MTFYSLPPFLTLCCFIGLAIMAGLRGLKTKVNLLFQLLCLLGCLLYVDILIIFNVQNPQVALWSSRIDHFFVVYTIPLYIHFFHAYLGITKRRWLVRAAYAYAFFLMWFTPTEWCIESMDRHFFGFFGRGGTLYPLIGIGALGATLYSLKLIHDAIGREPSGVPRNRLKYVLVGFGLMGLMNGLNSLPLLGYSIYPPGNFSFIPLLVFAFGLFKHDLLDMGLLIKKSLLYSVLTASLTGLYALLIVLINTIFKNYAFTDSIAFVVLLFLLISFLIGPLKNQLQKILDRVFSKDKYAYQQTIKRVSQTIASVLDADQIVTLLMDTIVDAMHVNRSAFFLRTASGAGFSLLAARGRFEGGVAHIGPDDPLVTQLLHHHKPIIKRRLTATAGRTGNRSVLTALNRLQAQIVLPLVFKERLNGFMALGAKKSGDLFSKEDLDLLETLASQSSLALVNAQAYRTIEDLNRNLETKIERRTAELQNALHEKERTQEQLIRSESLAALGQLVAGVAHELNNPLASVTSLIQTALEDLKELNQDCPVDPDVLDDLHFADKELKRAKTIVTSLLDLSRQTQTYSELVDLNTVIRDALRVLHNQYKHRQLNIVTRYDERLPAIQGNFANLGQVAINIIKNAIQAVSDLDGRIVLTTRFDQSADHVVFECRDTGPGVPQAVRKDIFKPFFTTKAVGQGTGLGLYISHEIVQRHGGHLCLEAPPDKGACFVIRLPATA